MLLLLFVLLKLIIEQLIAFFKIYNRLSFKRVRRLLLSFDFCRICNRVESICCCKNLSRNTHVNVCSCNISFIVIYSLIRNCNQVEIVAKVFCNICFFAKHSIVYI